MEPTMDALNLVWGYASSLEDAGLGGLVHLSGLPADETIAGCLSRFPHRYDWIRKGESPASLLADGPDFVEFISGLKTPDDLRSLPTRASLLLGTVVEERVERTLSDQFGRMAAMQFNMQVPYGTPVTRIYADSGPPFELETRVRMPGALDSPPVGKLVIAAVIVMGETPEGFPSGAVLVCDEASVPVLIPDYGLGLAGNYARSCLNQVLATNVDLRPYDMSTGSAVREHLRTLHGAGPEMEVADAQEMSAEVLRIFASRRHVAPVMPSARLVKTVYDAEAYAAEVMRAIGFADSRVTRAGNDAGIDVVSERGVAQVKMEGLPTGRPTIQALVGAATVEGKIPLFFSLAGYTEQAREWASLAGVAAFEFAFDGEIKPCTEFASRLIRNGLAAET